MYDRPGTNGGAGINLDFARGGTPPAVQKLSLTFARGDTPPGASPQYLHRLKSTRTTRTTRTGSYKELYQTKSKIVIIDKSASDIPEPGGSADV